MTAVPGLAEIRRRLGGHRAAVAHADGRSRAAVALVVCDPGPGPEVLFIRRAEHPRDPWSGHLGFPGGRLDPADPGPRAAAERETREELGLELAPEAYLGRLDDLPAAHLPVVISCFVYGVAARPALTPDPREVAEAFWFPLAELYDPARRREALFRFRGEHHRNPAIQVLEGGEPYLWGITLRLLTRFCDLLGRPL